MKEAAKHHLPGKVSVVQLRTLTGAVAEAAAASQINSRFYSRGSIAGNSASFRKAAPSNEGRNRPHTADPGGGTNHDVRHYHRHPAHVARAAAEKHRSLSLSIHPADGGACSVCRRR